MENSMKKESRIVLSIVIVCLLVFWSILQIIDKQTHMNFSCDQNDQLIVTYYDRIAIYPNSTIGVDINKQIEKTDTTCTSAFTLGNGFYFEMKVK